MASAIAKWLHCSNLNDFSVTPVEPMRMITTAVERISRKGEVIGPAERLSPWQALKALTIEPGKLADLVILDADPTAVPSADILKIAVVETFKERKSVYRAPAGS
ncbi:MAG: hypothetical protein ACKOPT_09060 [Cyanobium sp.]